MFKEKLRSHFDMAPTEGLYPLQCRYNDRSGFGRLLEMETFGFLVDYHQEAPLDKVVIEVTYNRESHLGIFGIIIVDAVWGPASAAAT